jgi:hypothetical protein
MCTIEGSVEMLLKLWNNVTQGEAVGTRDHFRRSDTICH